jgi:hypothetical protein
VRARDGYDSDGVKKGVLILTSAAVAVVVIVIVLLSR